MSTTRLASHRAGAHRAPRHRQPAVVVASTLLLGAAIGVATGPVTLPSARSVALERRAALAYVGAVEPLAERRVRLDRRAVLPAMRTARASAAGDEAVQRRAPRWLDSMAGIQAGWRSTDPPEELENAHSLFLLSLDSSLEAVRSLVVATESTVTARARLLDQAFEERLAAERMWSEGVALVREELAALGLPVPEGLRSFAGEQPG